MRKNVSDICEHFKAHWTRATAYITGGTVAAFLAVYFSLGGTAPAWFVWALVALAFYAASFFAWKDQRKEVDRLRNQIADTKRIVGIQNQIAAYYARGKTLLYFSYEKPLPASFVDDCQKWDDEVQEYLRSTLNELAAATFKHPDHNDLDREIQHTHSRRLSAQTRALQGIGVGVSVFVTQPSLIPGKAEPPQSPVS